MIVIIIDENDDDSGQPLRQNVYIYGCPLILQSLAMQSEFDCQIRMFNYGKIKMLSI